MRSRSELKEIRVKQIRLESHLNQKSIQIYCDFSINISKIQST